MSGEERFADHCRRRCIRPDAQLFYFSAENVNMLSSQLAKIMSRFVLDITKNFSDLSSARGKAQSDWIYVVSLTWKIKTQTDSLKLCLLWLSLVCIVPRNLLMRKDNGHTVFNRQWYFRKAVVGIYSGGLLNCYICDTTADIFWHHFHPNFLVDLLAHSKFTHEHARAVLRKALVKRRDYYSLVWSFMPQPQIF